MSKYLGACHCGGVRFEIETEQPLGPYFQCNCSLCSRKSAVMGAAPRDTLKVVAGEHLIATYTWNTHEAQHHFCRVCGIYTHHVMRGDTTTVGMNMACIDGVEVFALEDVEVGNGKKGWSLTADAEWEARLAGLWSGLDHFESAAAFVAAMQAMVDELPPGHPVALFELGAAHDSTGSPNEAVALYEAALASGLSGLRRRRVRIQLASSLRNLGKPQQAVDMLLQEQREHPSDALDPAVSAFLALALADLGREREALAISLSALSTYLPRYNRSLARYAEDLTVAPMATDAPKPAS